MKTKRATVQTETLFPELQNERRWETKGIFSDHYLRSHLRRSSYWPSDTYAKPIFEFISQLWKKRYVGFGKGNEEVTRKEFLDKILEKLGFAFLPNLDLPQVRQRQVPDYLLFEDEETKDRVFNEDDKTKYQAAVALMEAKKVNRNLDEVSDQDTPGKFPHQQIKDYLSNAADEATGEPFFRWGILTNGKIWRLYCRDAHPSSYFEFHLAGPEQHFCTYEEFQVFITLFQPQVFVRKDGRCALDDIREEAITFQTQLEENLRERIFKVVADLANGFWSYKDNRLTEGDLRDLYDNCLIYLYRLLFVLYAEGRGLLPVKLSGAGSNKHYRERYSLQRFIPKLRKGTEFQSEAFMDLYEELLKLFHLINGDKPSLNRECGVPRYNGGLFNPKLHPKLEQWRVGEKALAQVLRNVMFSAGHRERTSQPGFEFGTIDYADLEVRQLGDIYEGLLGGHLELEGNTLFPRSERGALQISGTVYTPDWVVRFLVEKTLKPLIDEIQKQEVQDAIRRGKKDNSFALRVLKLNVLDKAMGSGHFVVLATEWLADQIVDHPTTKFQVETVPPGISQEQAEVAYWRRRVVEACIYGVDSNALAVELSKLSLWLTCIAVNEPLNFLDHHLRTANSLIGAKLDELSVLPVHQDANQIPFSFGRTLTDAVSDAIKEIEAIEEEASTEVDIVKKKEERWRDKVLERLEPFKRVANLWTATAAGLGLNESEYVSLASAFVEPPKPRSKEAQEFKKLWEKHSAECERITTSLQPFHWELEFPDVFFHDDGTRKENPGFDAIFGNPPYISTQTSSAFEYRTALEQRFGFVDDLYVHFTFQGFILLRSGGMFGYIVSDTFFTLSTKLPMRELLQRNRILYLGQCDPFTTTVDAAIFVAQKGNAAENYLLDFIQARYATDRSSPEKELPEFAVKPSLLLMNGGEKIIVTGEKQPVLHGAHGCLRLHRIGINAYRYALKSTFFEPTEAIILLYNKFNQPLKQLVSEWWEKVETSKKYDENREEILKYHRTLKPGDVTLVGLIADGGQGMRTANNGRFLGFLEGTDQAKEILRRRKELLQLWNGNARIKPVLAKLLEENSHDFEAIVESLKSQFDPLRVLGLKRGEIYRVVPKNSLAAPDDFKRAYELRKAELEDFWKSSKEFKHAYEKYKADFGDDFCKLFEALVTLAEKRKTPLSKLAIRSGEHYTDETDAPRVASIYNGLPGKRTWVPFRKGDPEGNKWTDIEPLFINWTVDNVDWLATSSEARWQGQNMFFTEGVTYTLLGNHVALKAKLQPSCVFDAGASRLTPIIKEVSAFTFLSVLNSNIFSFLVRKFIKNTAAYEINDIRMAPFVIPTKDQATKLETFARRAVEAKELTLKKQDPSPELIKYCRQLAKEQQHAPKYLQPRPQLLLLDSSEDSLHAIELAVLWEVEKLYGVEGMGPFDEF